MFWLVMISTYVYLGGPNEVTSNNATGALHVGTFATMADCEGAASAAKYINRMGVTPSVSFICVRSGTLN
jgi:hypothetical protein